MRKLGSESIWPLFLLVTLGVLIRLWGLGSFPPGLYFDEVNYGLDAYSVLNTGRDLYGRFLPLTFQSSGYYPPLYTYVLVPFLAIFGLSVWVVRLPSVIAGILTIVGVYLMARELIGRKASCIPLIAAGMVTFSPWHTHLSRVAFLGGFGLPFVIFGIYFLIIPKRRIFIKILGTFLLAISIFAHYGYLLLSPAIFSIIFFLDFQRIKKLKWAIVSLLIIWVLAFTLYLISYKKYNLAFRVNELSGNSITQIASNYLGAYSIDFLFTSGESFRLNNPWGKGQLQLILLPFLILGLLRLGKLKRSSILLILTFLVLVPLPSAVAGFGKHAIRNSPMIVPLVILISLGFEYLILMPRSKLAKLALLIAIVGFLLQTGADLRYYFVTYPKDFGYLWGEPIRKAIDFGLERQKDYDAIVFADTYNVALSYLAFETQLSPQKLQETILAPTTIDNLPAKRIQNLYFIPTEEIANQKFYEILPSGTLLIDPIFYLNGPPLNLIENDQQRTFQYLEIN